MEAQLQVIHMHLSSNPMNRMFRDNQAETGKPGFSDVTGALHEHTNTMPTLR